MHACWWCTCRCCLLLPLSRCLSHSASLVFTIWLQSVSHLLLLLPSGDLCVFCPAPPPPPPSSPYPPSLILPLPETLSTNKGADLLIWGLCGCCLEGCVFVCVREWVRVCAHVCLCVFHRFGGCWRGRRDIFEWAEENWRQGRERRGMCREEKERLKGERQMQKEGDLL